MRIIALDQNDNIIWRGDAGDFVLWAATADPQTLQEMSRLVYIIRNGDFSRVVSLTDLLNLVADIVRKAME